MTWHRRLERLTLLTLCMGCIGCTDDCLFGPAQRPLPKVLWRDAEARFVLHRVIYPAVPDNLMDHRLVMIIGTHQRVLSKGQRQASDFSNFFHATRLPNGRLAWLLGDRLCLVASAREQRCTTLQSMDCPLFDPPKALPPSVHFRKAYRWVGSLAGQGPRQLAAAQALAELGLAREALLIARRIKDETRGRGPYLEQRRKGLEARLTGDATLRKELLRVFDRGGFCGQAAVLAACLPSMETMLARAVKSAPTRPRWQEGFRRLHAQCAARQPAPARQQL